MPTSSSSQGSQRDFSSLGCARKSSRGKTRFVPRDRLRVSSLLSRARELAFTVVLVAYIAQQYGSKEDHHIGLATLAIGSAVTFGMILSDRLHFWFGALFSSTQSALNTVSSTETISRIRSSVNASSMRLFSGRSSNGLVISATEPFLSKQDTAALTLADVKDLFRHAARLNGLAHYTSPRQSNRSTVQKAFVAMDLVSTLSRGSHTMPSSSSSCDGTSATTTSSSFGDMDALAFLSAARIFAEWRSLRLVPEGYHRYAVGMSLARRDLAHNVAKMEQAVHHYISSSSNRQTTSPTLRQLLQSEIAQDVHRQRPKLAEASGASGLLWMIRQLRYQTTILANIAAVPVHFPTTKAALQAAYHATYDPYHGFWTRQVFQASLDAAPAASEVLQYMNAPVISSCSRAPDDDDDKTQPLSDDDDDDDDWVHFPLDSERNSPEPTTSTTSSKQPLERLGGHIAQEWMKLLEFVGQCAGLEGQENPSRNAVSASILLSCHDNSKAGLDQVHAFVDFMQPFLDELEAVMEELNLNDPSRV